MKRSILLAGFAATALSLSPAAMAQGTATTTTEKPLTTANPKNTNNTQCAQPGETHTRSANCPKPATTAPTPTKTLPKSKSDKKTATPANATEPMTPPPTTNPAQACTKSNSPSVTAPTPSAPQCDTNSGAHEGGPFGH
ncbi:MAG: hypothetical protein JSR81_14665 [Proteobacteria bacterium]|nr:hypothetical protein [Pseudomonadota bacterium]